MYLKIPFFVVCLFLFKKKKCFLYLLGPACGRRNCKSVSAGNRWWQHHQGYQDQKACHPCYHCINDRQDESSDRQHISHIMWNSTIRDEPNLKLDVVDDTFGRNCYRTFGRLPWWQLDQLAPLPLLTTTVKRNEKHRIKTKRKKILQIHTQQLT